MSVLAAEGDKLIPKTNITLPKSVNRLADAPYIELRGSQCGGHAELVY
jgi:hypothetical protein